MRVSLPMSTVGRCCFFFSTRPTACASRSTKSGVIGGWPTVPRIPSVPKYFLVIVFLSVGIVLFGWLATRQVLKLFRAHREPERYALPGRRQAALLQRSAPC